MISEEDKQKVEMMDFSLYRHFGYPEIKEMGLGSFEDFTHRETVGEIYTINLSECRHNGQSFVLFDKQDLEKMLRHNIGAVEILVSDENKLSIINHYFHDGQE